ncbi:MAG TPA: multiubiquitin domain-containing protein [Rhizomicrobium sp.]|nr:multiubiquitin domain-containing protein [Rhizomicrobium sp.]
MADNEIVKIHIDQKPYQSPTPTTGKALLTLAGIAPGLILFKEVKGDREDEPLPDDHSVVHLKENEHLHSGQPAWVIFVNAEEKTVDHDVLTFEELVKIAFPVPPTGEKPEFTISFEGAASKPHDHKLHANQTVTVKNGTDFDVVHSNRS